MDNITHSLTGLAVGELIHRALPAEVNAQDNKVRRLLLLFSGWFASNFTDLDLVMTPLYHKPLGYLLTHRGHTHTFLYVIPQALLMIMAILLLWPAARRLCTQSRITRYGLALATALGFVLHISMDYLNSYGVHPFYPFNARWYYGDTVFIVEPFFWATMGTAVVMGFHSKLLKLAGIAFILGFPIFAAFKGFLPGMSAGVLTAISLLIILLQALTAPRSLAALALAFVIALVGVGIQGFASSKAKQMINAHLENKDQGFKTLDISGTAFPSNPLCWMFHSISANESAGTYRLRSGVASIAPHVLAVQNCPQGLMTGKDLKSESAELGFFNEANGKINEIQDLNQRNCHFNAWMRFTRMPVVTADRAYDLRFERPSQQNFTDLSFANFKNFECPRSVPQWTPPREDLLSIKGTENKFK